MNESTHYNLKHWFHIILLSCTIFASLPLFADDEVQDELANSAEIERYLEMIRTLPKNKRELLAQVGRDWLEAAQTGTLQEFLLSTSSTSVNFLVEGLAHRENPSDLTHYLDQLNDKDGTKIKLMISIAQKIQDNPARRERMLDAIEEIEEHSEGNHPLKNNVFRRLINSMLFIVDFAALTHSYWGQGLHNTYADNFFRFMGNTGFDLVVLGALVVPLTYELIHSPRSIPEYIRRWKQARRRKKNISFLRGILSRLRNNKNLNDELLKYSFIHTQEGRNTSYEELQKLAAQIKKDFELLNTAHPDEVQKAMQKLKIYDLLMREMQSSLTLYEIEYLARTYFSEDSTLNEALPLTLREKLGHWTKRSFRKIEQWIIDTELKDQSSQYALATRVEAINNEQRFAFMGRLLSSAKVNTATLTMAFVLFSLKASFGTAGVFPEESFMLQSLGHFVRENSSLFTWAGGILMMTPFATIIWDFFTQRRRRRDAAYQEMLSMVQAGLVSAVADPRDLSGVTAKSCSKMLSLR